LWVIYGRQDEMILHKLLLPLHLTNGMGEKCS
jgi:hypothetical protein